jgi:glycosyltransferase involved in cell wall biosynthesis
MAETLVTVLIDTYNHERFIERAITSVLEQDLPMDDVQILVVDDGSTDRTPELIRCFEPRVRLLRKPNGGQASAFNLGFAHARGEIIAMLDGDDWWEKERLRLVLEAFRDNPDIGAIGNGLYEVDTDGQRLYVNKPDRSYRLFFASIGEAVQFRELMSYMGTSRLGIRRSVLDKILPVPEDIVIEADEYLATLAVATSGALVLDRPLTNYRFHPGNLYQYGKFNLEKARRKANALVCLGRELPKRLLALGISSEIVAAILEPRNVEAERLRLTVDGGVPWESFRVERAACRLAYKEVSPGYRLFHFLVLLLTLVMPPKLFYRIRSWYADRGLQRVREVIGKPILAEPLGERRAIRGAR